ncbi:MAG: hypothetical protein QNJ14_04105 [Woeseiaceae bacterium]|nr:hypothetical protein [Woeseiaceae bacterium]
MINFFGTPAMLALDALMVIYTLWVLSLNRETNKARGLIAAGMFGWMAVLFGIFSTQSLFPADISSVSFYAAILTGVAVFGALLFGVRPIREYVMSLDQRQLMMIQGIRVYFGATFLIQGGLGLLPATFGLIDGLTHISAGFFGLVAAFAVAAGTQARRRAWFANAFGLGDILIVATSLAFVLLKDIGPHHPMMYAVFLPAPLWLWAHVVSIYKLITEREDTVTRTTSSDVSRARA